MLFKQWREFVIYPLNSDKVKTFEQRVDISQAYRISSNEKYPQYLEDNVKNGIIFDHATVVAGEDEFEAMNIDQFGHVIIWTIKKVWYLNKEGENSKIEKMRYVPRNPIMQNL